MHIALRQIIIALLLAAGFTTSAAAQEEARISDLSALDKQFMQQQRDALEDIAARNLGRSFSGNKQNDLEILQQLLDRKLVRADQTRELQAMGVIMGDLLASELNLHWVIYEDKVGRSRALRYRDSDEYLFPITMISRRREADNRAPVEEIYRKAADIMAQSQPALPFQ
tara:strand:+ start:219204 stop:219710 length:507 start_codon:yes stop_codon:yes gene_type:complete